MVLVSAFTGHFEASCSAPTALRFSRAKFGWRKKRDRVAPGPWRASPWDCWSPLDGSKWEEAGRDPGVLGFPGLPLTSWLAPQVQVTSAVLKAAAHHYGARCDRPNKEFMLCRWEEKDPRKCLKEGKEVNKCALDFFRQVRLHCAAPFTRYWTCVDYSNLLELRRCREQQRLFDECVLEKLGWARPDLGQLSKVTKVKTDRPLPENPYHSRQRPAPNPPTESELQPSKYGSKMYFFNF